MGICGKAAWQNLGISQKALPQPPLHPFPGRESQCFHPGSLLVRYYTAPRFLSELTINKPLFGTLSGEAFHKQQGLKRNDHKPKPCTELYFFWEGLKKRGKLYMFTGWWYTFDMSVYVTISLLIWSSINLSWQLHSDLQKDFELCHALYQVWRDGCK